MLEAGHWVGEEIFVSGRGTVLTDPGRLSTEVIVIR
jgi:hypothetical protein